MDSKVIKTISFSVRGRVQGVFFRKYTKQTADRLGLTGDVRNMADGSVFGHAQGTEENLKSFVEWLHRGSPKSKVDKVSTKEVSSDPLTGFVVLR